MLFKLLFNNFQWPILVPATRPSRNHSTNFVSSLNIYYIEGCYFTSLKQIITNRTNNGKRPILGCSTNILRSVVNIHIYEYDKIFNYLCFSARALANKPSALVCGAKGSIRGPAFRMLYVQVVVLIFVQFILSGQNITHGQKFIWLEI